MIKVVTRRSGNPKWIILFSKRVEVYDVGIGKILKRRGVKGEGIIEEDGSAVVLVG